jgi:hypothetical protein
MLMEEGFGLMVAGVQDSIESFKFSNATSVIGVSNKALGGKGLHQTSSKSFFPD